MEKAPKQRTHIQNRALHRFFELLACELNDNGLDMKKVLKPSVDIPWTPASIKAHIWKPIQDAQLVKKSTTELTTDEVSKVYETINRFMGEKFGVHVGFPSEELLALEQLQNDETNKI
jgi:hypothetical protein